MKVKKIVAWILLIIVTALLSLATTILPMSNIAQAHTQQVNTTQISEASCPKPPNMNEYFFYEGNKTEPAGWWGANGEQLTNREEIFNFCSHYGLISFEQKGRSVVIKWLIKPSKAYTVKISAEGFSKRIRAFKVGILDTTLPKENVVAKINILN